MRAMILLLCHVNYQIFFFLHFLDRMWNGRWNSNKYLVYGDLYAIVFFLFLLYNVHTSEILSPADRYARIRQEFSISDVNGKKSNVLRRADDGYRWNFCNSSFRRTANESLAFRRNPKELAIFPFYTYVGTSSGPVNGTIKGLSVFAMFVFDYHRVDWPNVSLELSPPTPYNFVMYFWTDYNIGHWDKGGFAFFIIFFLFYGLLMTLRLS